MTATLANDDPILAEVVRHGLEAVAEEMGAALVHTAHSVNIRDRRDFSCGVFTAAGDLAAQAEHIPVHLGLLAGIVGRIETRIGQPIDRGTMLVTNDPWLSGSHLPDVVVVAPVDAGGRRLGYVANMAHQVDVGGIAPGSLSLGVREIYAEGLRVPPLALVRDGRVDDRVVDLFRLNSRTPQTVVGDLLAQVAACTTGSLRLTELDVRTGADRLAAAIDLLIRSTADRLGRRIAALGDRSASFGDVLEWTQDGRDEDLAITVHLAAKGDRLVADFAGTAAQVAGPINATRPLTMSCLLYVIKTMLDPDLASNAGLFRQVELRTQPGTLVDAQEPGAVALCTSITSQRICDALIGAFNQLVPERAIAASTGSMNALIIGGLDQAGRPYSYVETYAGGQGASAHQDGADAVHTHMTNTANSPVELIERAYPMTVLEYAILPATGGAGRWRGGHGITRAIRVEEPAIVTVHLDRTRHRPWGLDGGGAGSLARAVLGQAERRDAIPGKCTVSVPAGTIIRVETAGGGGFGAADDRADAARAADRLDELVPGVP